MIDTITIDLDGMKTGTVLTVKDIPELMGKKIELQVKKRALIHLNGIIARNYLLSNKK